MDDFKELLKTMWIYQIFMDLQNWGGDLVVQTKRISKLPDFLKNFLIKSSWICRIEVGILQPIQNAFQNSPTFLKLIKIWLRCANLKIFLNLPFMLEGGHGLKFSSIWQKFSNCHISVKFSSNLKKSVSFGKHFEWAAIYYP